MNPWSSTTSPLPSPFDTVIAHAVPAASTTDTWVVPRDRTGSVDSECADLFVPDYMTIAGNATRGDLHPGSAGLKKILDNYR